MNPYLSIIIPCYNSAATAEETFLSVLEQNYNSWEAIIVNDGSPDNIEEIALKWVEKDNRFKYFKKENGGLGTARNFGIKKATGKYILPLDSDNKVEKNYAQTAIPILEKNSKIGVIYGNPMLFEDKQGEKIIGGFDVTKLIKTNYIDACAIIKKEVYTTVGLYDTKMPYQGVEDWELWIRTIKNKFKFYYLNKITYYYRVTSSSMIRSYNNDMTERSKAYIYKKHFMFFISTILKNKKQLSNWRTLLTNITKKVIKY